MPVILGRSGRGNPARFARFLKMVVNSWWSAEDEKVSRGRAKDYEFHHKRAQQRKPKGIIRNEYAGRRQDPYKTWVWADSKGKWTWDHTGDTASHVYKQGGFHIDQPPPHEGLYDYEKVGTRAWRSAEAGRKRVAIEKWRGEKKRFNISGKKVGMGYKRKRGRGYVSSRKGRRLNPRGGGGYSRRRMTRWGGMNGSRFRSQKQELKFYDDVCTDGAIATAGTVQCATILEIPAGTGPSQRLGRRIFLRSLDVKFNILLNNDSPGGRDEVRIIIFHDKQCNGAAAVPGDILDLAGATHKWLAFRNLEHTKRFNILCDKRISMVAQAGAYDGANQRWGGATKHFSKHINLHGMPIDYEDVTGAITELTSNNIGVMTISSSNECDLNAQFRFRYSG